MLCMRNFENAKKIVIKIGTNTLTKQGTNEIDTDYIQLIAGQIAELRKKDKQVVIITSGAIGMGAGQLSEYQGIRPSDIKMRQACAAIGQPMLMAEYREAFEQFGVDMKRLSFQTNNGKEFIGCFRQDRTRDG
jgi:glutamate 5-kinase